MTSINFIRNKKTILQNDSTEINYHTKRALIQRILDNQIKVLHTLERQILQRKKLKCFIHGSNRDIQLPKKFIQNKKILFKSKDSTQRYSRNIQKIVIEAPNIIGVKNKFCSNHLDLQKTKYRSNSTAQTNRFGLRSCCHMRSQHSLATRDVKIYRTGIQSRQLTRKVKINLQTKPIKSIIKPESSRQFDQIENIQHQQDYQTLGFYESQAQIRVNKVYKI